MSIEKAKYGSHRDKAMARVKARGGDVIAQGEAYERPSRAGVKARTPGDRMENASTSGRFARSMRSAAKNTSNHPRHRELAAESARRSGRSAKANRSMARRGVRRRVRKAYDPIEVVLDRLAEQRGEAIAKSLDDLVVKKCAKCKPGKKCKMHAEPDGDGVEKKRRKGKAKRNAGGYAAIGVAGLLAGERFGRIQERRRAAAKPQRPKKVSKS